MLTVRAAQRKDLPAMLAIYRPYVCETTVSFEYVPPDLAAFTRRFESITAQFPWLVAEEDGAVLGYAYAGRLFSRAAYAWDAEPSVYVAQNARGCGIGTALYDTLESELTGMGFVNLFALITAENTASIVFHTRRGYRQVGTLPHAGYKFGRWLDVVWMQKILRDDLPPAPLPALNL